MINGTCELTDFSLAVERLVRRRMEGLELARR